MTTAAKVAGFVAALAAVFVLALGVGSVLGPVAEPSAAAHEARGAGAAGADGQGEQATSDQSDLPAGLMSSQDGYTLSLAEPTAAAGRDIPVRFTVTGPDGRPVTAYDVAHGKRLHLVAVRRDATGFQHVHPRLSRHGTWSTALDLTPGQWRLFADFRASAGEALTLGTDLAVAGSYRPAVGAGESRTAEVDGYTVTLDGDLAGGADATLTLSAERDGEPVTDLEPYLGAYGHLVALRAGDLAYLHVHPDGTPGDGRTRPGPLVAFHAAVPSPSTYHLYLDFQHRGVVHTAAFEVRSAGRAGGTVPAATGSGDGHTTH
ncbi:MAG: hypothetical protein WB441_12130 [Nocardioidaceae bacterium]